MEITTPFISDVPQGEPATLINSKHDKKPFIRSVPLTEFGLHVSSKIQRERGTDTLEHPQGTNLRL